MPEKRSITIKLNEAIYKKLRMYSVEHDQSIQRIVEDAITKHVEKKVK